MPNLKSGAYKYIVPLIAGLTLMYATYLSAVIHFNSQFRVVYSLDTRRNDQEIVRLIDSANKYVYFAIYYFTEKDIADSLVRARQRGLVVRGIMDRDAAVGSNKVVIEMLQLAGIPIETQKHQDGIMHLKVLVTDKAYASGSYNWTQSATESNDEVLEISSNRYLHDRYLAIVKRVLQVNE